MKRSKPAKKIYPGYLRRPKPSAGKKPFIASTLLLAVALFLANAEGVSHRVKENETLYALSRRYGVSVSQIQLANNINDAVTLKAGQELAIPIQSYIIEKGDTLSSVADRLQIDAKKLRQLNKLKNDALKAGQKLVIPQKPYEGQIYVAQKGDTLSYVSMRFDISQTKLAQLNDLESPLLKEGQTLHLTATRPEGYIVQQNDTLYSLARQYNVSVDQLMQYNALNAALIYPGQKLLMYNPSVSDFDEDIWSPKTAPQARSQIALAEKPQAKPLQEAKPPVKYAAFNPQQPYFSRAPKYKSQPNATYAEPVLNDVKTDFKDAKELMRQFDRDLESMGPLSGKLKDYAIVIDPGHGGYDPGALIEAKIDGKTVYLVEDEYVYDISLRLYALLKRHGARATMTILAPNHTIRDNGSDETFVNQKNEVYNDASFGPSVRPIGGHNGLKRRKDIAEKFFRGTPKDKRIFLSVHADTSPGNALGLVAVAANPTSESQKLAAALIKEAGRGREIKIDYVVLKENPAQAAVLIEARNLNQGEAAIINNCKSRQNDAQTIAAAILNYVQ